jgi:hypothetical protein
MKMIYRGFEFVGERTELLEIMKDLAEKSHLSSHRDDTDDIKDEAKGESWHWTEAAVFQVLDSLTDDVYKLIRAFQTSSSLKYDKFCKLTGYSAQKMAIRLTAITRASRKILKNEEAWLIERKWTVARDRQARDYFIDPTAYPFVLKYLEKHP